MATSVYICVNLWLQFLMKTALIHHPINQKHDTGPGHPETPMRYEVVMDALRDDKELWDRLAQITPQKASKGLIQAAHTPQHFKEIENAFANGYDPPGADTTISLPALYPS